MEGRWQDNGAECSLVAPPDMVAASLRHAERAGRAPGTPGRASAGPRTGSPGRGPQPPAQLSQTNPALSELSEGRPIHKERTMGGPRERTCGGRPGAVSRRHARPPRGATREVGSPAGRRGLMPDIWGSQVQAGGPQGPAPGCKRTVQEASLPRSTQGLPGAMPPLRKPPTRPPRASRAAT